MWQRLLLGFLLAVAAFFVVRYFNKEGFTNWDSVVETPAPGPYRREPIPRGDMNVAPGGPNSPNVAAPLSMPAVRMPPAEASDPYAVTQDSADAPERLRHPERLFGPGIQPTDNQLGVVAGVASEAPSVSPQAFQTFSPEHVTNGGNFFGTVSALEDENPNYSAF
jgi:hypothetical protein